MQRKAFNTSETDLQNKTEKGNKETEHSGISEPTLPPDHGLIDDLCYRGRTK